MSKVFNISADCKPGLHYMVDISQRLKMIKGYVDRGEYFTINRARQYGKTTTLRALESFLQEKYLVVNLDFQKLGEAKFKDENTFSLAFARAFLRAIRARKTESFKSDESSFFVLIEAVNNHDKNFELFELFENLSDICSVSEKPVVLVIDEVDSAANNQVFLDFLAQLRAYYIDRDLVPTFQSVILAGVYDVRNLKRKFREDEEHKRNSPWNIAADFDIDMSFSKTDIKGMLAEYERDYKTGMDMDEMARRIHEYTSGYPFLVSRICQILDEKLSRTQEFPEKKDAWTTEGFLKAIRILLSEKSTLFETLVNKLSDYPELREIIYAILFNGDKISFNHDNEIIDLAFMLGFIKDVNGTIAIANRIFEMRLYNLFLSEEEINSRIFNVGARDKNQFIRNGMLDMQLVLEKFMVCWEDLYHSADEKFIEDNGRKFFLLYLKPIINGVGNYYIESRTRDNGRTDIIVDYLGQQFIIEIKIWRGEEYNKRGEKQLADYLDAYHVQKGYMLSFNFNKNKVVGTKEIQCSDKIIFEAVV